MCRGLPRVDNQTAVVIFQHPRERFHPLGTARFADLGLARSRVETLWPRAVGERPGWLRNDAMLLYPKPGARSLGDIAEHERPRQLVVVDGTWHHARTLHRDTPWLRGLPSVRLAPSEPSRYRLRREPRFECLSTIEAILSALEELEPETAGLDDLRAAFDRMIDRQIEFLGAAGRGPRRRQRPEAQRGLPRAIVDDFDRVVVVYGESSCSGAEHEILQWTAIRPSTGETFDSLARPTRSLLRPWHLRHMRLDGEALFQAPSIAELKRQWRQFVRPRDVFVAWNQSSTELLVRHLDSEARPLVLKSICRSVRPSSRGCIEDVLHDEGLRSVPARLRGRAGVRVGNALALVEHFHARAASTGPTSVRAASLA